MGLALPEGRAKERYVRELFARIAPVYDFMNVALSVGCLHLWWKVFSKKTGLRPGGRALDVCTGTGELALILAGQVGPSGTVLGLDFSPEMLAVARRKIERRGLEQVVRLVEGNALQLPWADGTFDAVTMGFALRNVSDIPRAIGEIARVTRPGGRVLILELSRPSSALIRYPYFLYFHGVVPALGRLAARKTGDGLHPYAYLPASLAALPDPESLSRCLRHAGLTGVRHFGLTGGIAALHVGRKPWRAADEGTGPPEKE